MNEPPKMLRAAADLGLRPKEVPNLPPCTRTIKTRVRTGIEFEYNNDRVTIEGKCDSLQDLRDALRELLNGLEQQ